MSGKIWNRINRFLVRDKVNVWVPYLLTCLGGITILLGLWFFAHNQAADIDEGFYAYEGYLYARGEYRLFQDYGFPANQMPLAYLIPGYIQRWFGPDFIVGRIAATFFAMLMVLGIWIASKRLGGKWVAMAIVWAIALNPAGLRLYSTLTSQVITACMLAWVMVFLLGDRRPLWSILIAAFITGLVLITRVNMLPLLPLVLFYVFWQHGIKAGFWALLVSLLPMALVHLVYWPNILRLWSFWLPASVTPFLDAWRLPSDLLWAWNPSYRAGARMESIIFALRSHTVAIVGGIASWLFWPAKGKWRGLARHKASIFLSVLFITLLLEHFWAAILNNYCVYCLESYLSFFSILGLLLVAVSFPEWQYHLSKRKQLIVILIAIALLALLYSQHDPMWLLQIQVPRIREGSLIGGSTSLWGVIQNKFQVSLEDQKSVSRIILYTLSVAFVLLISKRITRRINRVPTTVSFGAAVMLVLLGGTLFLSPSNFLGNHYQTYDCDSRVTTSYKVVGTMLADVVPPDSSVFWGVYTPIILLYAPEMDIHPPQIYASYYTTTSGDPDIVLKYGWWNDQLAQQWIDGSDVALIEEWYLQLHPEITNRLDAAGYQETHQTPLTNPCRVDSYIHVYQRNRP